MRLQMITAALLIGPCAGALMAQDSTQAQGRTGTQQDTTYKSRSSVNAYGTDSAQSDEMVLMKVHRTNQMEIRLGQLAQRNASSARVKSFAQRIVRDHQAADKKVTTLAQSMGVTLARGWDSTGGRWGRGEGHYGADSTRGRYGRGHYGADSTRGQYGRDTLDQGRYGRRDSTMMDSTNRGGYSQRYDTAQLMDLVFTVGNYTLVSMALNTLGVRLEAGIAGFAR